MSEPEPLPEQKKTHSPDDPYVLFKDTERKGVALCKVGERNDPECYPNYWTSYKDEAEYSNVLGWLSAPDERYASNNEKVAESLKYLTRGPVDDYNPDTVDEKTKLGYDANAPYGLWAQHALNKVKIFLNSCKFEEPDGRDVAFESIAEFLDDCICGRPATLNLQSCSIGMSSNLLTNMGLYLGNFQHEDKQIQEQLGIDTPLS